MKLAASHNVARMCKDEIVRECFKESGPHHVCEVGVGGTSFCHVTQWIQKTRVTLVDANSVCCESCRKLFGTAVDVHWAAIVGHDCKESQVKLRMLRPGRLCGRNYVEGVNSPHLQNNPAHFKYVTLVPAVTFDKIDDGTIDYLTVDIEGSELYVIENMVSRPKIVFVEMQCDVYDNPHLKEIQQIMEERGYVRIAGLQLAADWGWRLK